MADNKEQASDAGSQPTPEAAPVTMEALSQLLAQFKSDILGEVTSKVAAEQASLSADRNLAGGSSYDPDATANHQARLGANEAIDHPHIGEMVAAVQEAIQGRGNHRLNALYNTYFPPEPVAA